MKTLWYIAQYACLLIAATLCLAVLLGVVMAVDSMLAEPAHIGRST